MKPKLIDEISIFLLKKGFTIKSLSRTCFDIVARRKGTILLLKTLEDANAISKEHTAEMETMAAYIAASPLIIAKKAGALLQDGVVYSRFNIFTLTMKTLQDAIDNNLPFIFSGNAGLTASVRGAQLRKKREEQGLSPKGVSRKVGVSARMIAKYESNNAEVTLGKAFKLYDVFGGSIFRKINVFSYTFDVGTGTSTVSKKYLELGFHATETKKVPFDIIAKKDDELILTEIGDGDSSQLHSLSRLLDADNLVIFKKKKPKNIPSLTKEEFMDFEEANELIKFLKEF